MLTLITGVPGAGKTLRSITLIEARRLKESREVYQFGVKGLTYQWKALENPKAWADVPDGSIVFIDEAWEWFPVRKQGSVVPEYVERLATHRHRGLDIYLATQGRTQLDIFVRNLVGHHMHLDRRYGMQYSMVYEWNREGDPKSTKDIATANANRWQFPKEAYAAYTSATEHTHKARPPWKKISLAIGCIGGAVALTAWGLSRVAHGHDTPPPTLKQTASGAIDRSGFGGVDYWLMGRQPRLAGHPESAAIYDPLQKVKSQPRVVGCMEFEYSNKIDCRCAGPNHTRIDMLQSQCLQLVRNGVFDETRTYPELGAEDSNQLRKNSSSEAQGSHVGG